MTIEWRLEKIYTPEEEEERAAKALGLNGMTMKPEPETELKAASLNNLVHLVDKLELKAASNTKTKPTVRVNRLGYKPPQRQQQQTKLKAAASPHPPPSLTPLQQAKLKAAAASSSVQIAAVVPTHDIPNHIIQSLNPDKTTLIAKTSCLRCGEKASQILQFTPGSEIRPTANPKVLKGYCQACRGDLLAHYSGSALK